MNNIKRNEVEKSIEKGTKFFKEVFREIVNDPIPSSYEVKYSNGKIVKISREEFIDLTVGKKKEDAKNPPILYKVIWKSSNYGVSRKDDNDKPWNDKEKKDSRIEDKKNNYEEIFYGWREEVPVGETKGEEKLIFYHKKWESGRNYGKKQREIEKSPSKNSSPVIPTPQKTTTIQQSSDKGEDTVKKPMPAVSQELGEISQDTKVLSEKEKLEKEAELVATTNRQNLSSKNNNNQNIGGYVIGGGLVALLVSAGVILTVKKRR